MKHDSTGLEEFDIGGLSNVIVNALGPLLAALAARGLPVELIRHDLARLIHEGGIWNGRGSVFGECRIGSLLNWAAKLTAWAILPVAGIQPSYFYGEPDVFYTTSQCRAVCV